MKCEFCDKTDGLRLRIGPETVEDGDLETPALVVNGQRLKVHPRCDEHVADQNQTV